MRLGVGRTGVVILVALFVILGAENVYVWAIAGTVSGVESSLALMFVPAVASVTIWEAWAYSLSR